MDEIIQIIFDFEIPSLFSTDISHSTPVPQSTHFRMGTFAVVIGRTPETCPIPKEEICPILFEFYTRIVLAGKGHLSVKM